MINRFENYNDLRTYTKYVSDSAMKGVEAIKKLKILVEKGSFTEEYYEKQNKNLKLLAEELSSCLILKKDILNSKTNEKIINIILDILNNGENKYKLVMLQIAGYDKVYKLDKYYHETYPKINEKVIFSIFLVREDILDASLAKRIHNEEEYDSLTKEGIVIDLKSAPLTTNKEDIKSYFEDRTIDIDNIVGLNKDIKEKTYEKLFGDYKYHQNKVKAK